MAFTAVPPYGGVVLQKGSTGPDTALVQTLLNGLAQKGRPVSSLGVDGKYGSATQESVRRYQTLAGIKVDGKVGPVTWNRLCADYAALYGPGEVYPGISMRQGHRGATVRSAQQKLSAAGIPLTADGIYGSRTQAAVRTFQARNGLGVDGILGKKTWAALQQAG